MRSAHAHCVDIRERSAAQIFIRFYKAALIRQAGAITECVYPAECSPVNGIGEGDFTCLDFNAKCIAFCNMDSACFNFPGFNIGEKGNVPVS